jgi:glutamate racemase
MIEKAVDTVVLGCTHYPFVIPLIQQIVGPGVQVIDPAPAVARQAGRLLEARNLRASDNQRGDVRYFTTGDPYRFGEMLPRLIGHADVVQYARWDYGQLR